MSRALHCSKAPVPIYCTFEGKREGTMLIQFWKEETPIVQRESEKETWVRFMQPEKALEPISETESCIITDVKASQFSKE